MSKPLTQHDRLTRLEHTTGELLKVDIKQLAEMSDFIQKLYGAFAKTKKHVKDVDELAGLLEALPEMVMKTRERALTEKQKGLCIYKVWGFVRNNAEDLDSEKTCRKIGEIFDTVTGHQQKRIEEANAEALQWKAKYQKERKRNAKR